MPNTIDSRDNSAPYNLEQLPKLTREEEQDEYISELKHKMSFMIKKSEVKKILDYYGDENPRTQIIKLKKLLEL